MLNEPELELLTEGVDGEQAPGRRAELDRLLADSSSAAELFAAMVRDRTRIASIPTQSAPAGLATGIMAAITRDCPIVPRPQPARRPSWIPAAMAASFLVAVSSATYWFVAGNPSQRTATARQIEQLPRQPDASGTRPRTLPAAVKPDTAPPEVPSVPSNVETKPTGPEAVAVTPAPTPMTPVAPEIDPSRILTAPVGTDVKAFDRVDVKLPLLVSFSDLTRDESQTMLRQNLTKDVATRIDLFAKDSTKAAESLVASAKTVNLNIGIELIAGERMKRKMPSAWLIHTDSLSVDDVLKWLRETAEKDAAAPASDRVFGTLHAVAAGIQEQKEIASMVGIDLGIGKKSANSGDGHISSKTIDQVATNLQKNDSPKPGLLLTYQPQGVRVFAQNSKDVKQYLELRKDRKPGGVQLLIVVRPAS